MSNQPNLDPVNLGTAPHNIPFAVNLSLLLTSNALLTANSGGGKSWALRRMIEQAFGHVQQIIIDPEGEFSTLRSKYDVVLVGKGGDTPADLRSAKLLALRLLELGTSAVIDLYEMTKANQLLWVAAFVQALVDAPKSLWRNLLLYADESHMFAPQPGHGVQESAAEKLCRAALIDFAAKGRKRGYGIVAATQRLGKLSKDFAAELKNVLVGQTFLDIDRERAADCLGITKASKQDFFQNIKLLQPGRFYALGRAFGCLEPTLIKIGIVQTEHPEAGRRQSAAPPPTAKIRHLLPQLADLPKEAEDTLVTEKQLRARIAELEQAAKAAPVPVPVKQDSAAIRANTAALKACADAREKLTRILDKYIGAVPGVVIDLQELMRTHEERLDTLAATLRLAQAELREPAQASGAPGSDNRMVGIDGKIWHVSSPPAPRLRSVPAPTPLGAPTGGVRLNRAAERAVLTALKQRGPLDRSRLAVTAGYAGRGGGFLGALSKLRTAGYITEADDKFMITEAGDSAIGDVAPLPTGKALVAYWMGQLNRRAEREVLRVLVSVYPARRSAEDIARSTDQGDGTPYEARGGGFLGAVSKLRTLGLIEGSASALAATEEFFT